jgi:hypothetical protein
MGTAAYPIARYGYYGRGFWGYRRGFEREYTPICTGPCTARFAPGQYDFALSKNGRIIPTHPVFISGPSVLHARYVDRSGLRVAGVVIGIGGIVAGSVMMIAATERQDRCDDAGYCYTTDRTTNGPLLGAGIGVLVGSVIAGSIMAWQPDEARIAVLPMSTGSLGPNDSRRLAAALPEGASLRVRF